VERPALICRAAAAAGEAEVDRLRLEAALATARAG